MKSEYLLCLLTEMRLNKAAYSGITFIEAKYSVVVATIACQA